MACKEWARIRCEELEPGNREKPAEPLATGAKPERIDRQCSLFFKDQHMTQVIEGLKVTVAGSEVAELATKQASFHASRAAFYGKQVEMYAGVQDGAPGIQYTSHQDPKAAALQKQEEHQQKAEHLNFIAAHVKADAEYLLDNSALSTLGVLKGSRFF